MKVLHSIWQRIWKTKQGPQDQKCQFSFQSHRKVMPKNAQITAHLNSSHRQIWPCSTEWSRATANRVLRERTGHGKHPLLTTQENTLHMDITRWSTLKSDWLYSLPLKNGEVLNSQQKQDWELTVAQIMKPLWPNSDWNWRKWGKPLDHSDLT